MKFAMPGVLTGLAVAGLAFVALAATGAPSLGQSAAFASPSAAIPGKAAPPAFRPDRPGIPDSALVPHQNPQFGYTIKLPPAYRRAVSNVEPQNTGVDMYTPRSDAQDQAICATEKQGDLQSPERVTDIRVVVSANPDGTTPSAYASAANRKIAFTSVDSVTIDGNSAARVRYDNSGDTAYYVISANNRLYEVAPMVFEQPTTQPKGWIDQIAKSFKATSIQSTAAPSARRPLCGN